MIEWSGISKHKQKKLCPSSKGRDNFLYSQKNICLAAETTKCASPEARMPVKAIYSVLCLCGRKKLSSDPVCYKVLVVQELCSVAEGKSN